MCIYHGDHIFLDIGVFKACILNDHCIFLSIRVYLKHSLCLPGDTCILTVTIKVAIHPHQVLVAVEQASTARHMCIVIGVYIRMSLGFGECLRFS